jgi:hypothetical protein
MSFQKIDLDALEAVTGGWCGTQPKTPSASCPPSTPYPSSTPQYPWPSAPAAPQMPGWSGWSGWGGGRQSSGCSSGRRSNGGC